MLPARKGLRPRRLEGRLRQQSAEEKRTGQEEWDGTGKTGKRRTGTITLE